MTSTTIFYGILVSLMYIVIYACMGALVVLSYGLLSEKVCDAIFKKNSELGENVWAVCLLIVIIIVGIFVIGRGVYDGFPQIAIEEAKWEQPYNYTTHQIVNLSDNSEIEGSINGRRRYVRGYIGEETVYHYYYKCADGGFKLQKASEKNTTIYFTDGEPRAEWYSQTRSFWWHSETKYFCKIYIPEGSMTTEFEIDME